MSSNALKSQGIDFQMGDGGGTEVFATINEVMSISGPGGSAAVIDVTDLKSTAKEKRMGLQDEGQITLEINYIPTDTKHALLRTAKADGDPRNFRIIFTDAGTTQWDFAALVTGFAVSAAVDDVVKASVTLEVTGAITES